MSPSYQPRSSVSRKYQSANTKDLLCYLLDFVLVMFWIRKEARRVRKCVQGREEKKDGSIDKGGIRWVKETSGKKLSREWGERGGREGRIVKGEERRGKWEEREVRREGKEKREERRERREGREKRKERKRSVCGRCWVVHVLRSDPIREYICRSPRGSWTWRSLSWVLKVYSPDDIQVKSLMAYTPSSMFGLSNDSSGLHQPRGPCSMAPPGLKVEQEPSLHVPTAHHPHAQLHHHHHHRTGTSAWIQPTMMIDQAALQR